jgi:phosphoribosylformylglycinamidine cyclo-ligase
MVIARQVGKYDTMGYDLLGMVVDDAICIGAEVVSVSNTIDVEKVDKDVISQLMEGLKKACIEQKVVIPGGEIAELGTMVNGYIWNATAIGVVKKDRFITGDNIKAGDQIIGLGSNVFRSNGISLVRYVLSEKFGNEWFKEDFGNGMTWGEVALTPTKIYHACVLDMIGRYGQPSSVDVKGIAHITGGGLPGNIIRIIKKKGLGAKLTNLPKPHEAVLKVKEYGSVSDEEAYKTWNMGIGMVLVCNEYEKVKQIAEKHGVKAYKIGELTSDQGIWIDDMKF